MGMFKYSSEVVPTQTLQLNTIKVCLCTFESHNLKLPSSEQEAILSSCKNNPSRFFPLPYWDEFDKLQSPFLQSLKYFHSLLPQPAMRTGPGDTQDIKDAPVGLCTPVYVRCTLTGLQPLCRLEISISSSVLSNQCIYECFQSIGAIPETGTTGM